MKNLQFYAIISNINTNKLEYIEVLRYLDINKIKNMKTMADLKEYINREFSYYFAYRREYEICIGDLNEKDIKKYEKYDVYKQLLPNLDVIAKYIKNELKLEIK